jgi:hypothetical protein
MLLKVVLNTIKQTNKQSMHSFRLDIKLHVYTICIHLPTLTPVLSILQINNQQRKVKID